MKRILLLILITLTLLSITAVSAEDNATLISDEIAVDDEPLAQDTSDEIIGNDTGGGDESDVEVNKTDSTITASNVKGYESFTTTVNIKLTSNGTALSSRALQIILNGVTYIKITDANGEVKLKVKLDKGKYTAKITYLGDDLTSNATKTCKITINAPSATKLKIGDKYINYRQGSKCLFYVKLLDANNKAVKNQNVTFKVAGKTYTAKTDKNGVAKVYLNLKKGTHTVKYSFKKNAPYISSSGSFKIKVRAKMAKGNGYHSNTAGLPENFGGSVAHVWGGLHHRPQRIRAPSRQGCAQRIACHRLYAPGLVGRVHDPTQQRLWSHRAQPRMPGDDQQFFMHGVPHGRRMVGAAGMGQRLTVDRGAHGGTHRGAHRNGDGCGARHPCRTR